MARAERQPRSNGPVPTRAAVVQSPSYVSRRPGSRKVLFFTVALLLEAPSKGRRQGGDFLVRLSIVLVQLRL